MDVYTAELNRHLDAVEAALPLYLPRTDTLQGTVSKAMAYACDKGGKRLRPVLLLEFTRLCGGNPETAMPFACAIEMLHSYSLVHDDLPCMDDSPLRRGRPSAHTAFGEDMALLAGDALLTRAFEAMLDPAAGRELSAGRSMEAAFLLARAAGIDGMVGGQTIDLESEERPIDLETLEALQRGKTAALLQAACEMGAVLAGASEERRKAAAAYGEAVGLCFQIVDDILDVTATAEELGKPAGSDQVNQKSTYVSLLGLEAARELARERTVQAVESLAVFGAPADGLRTLAQALLTRRH